MRTSLFVLQWIQRRNTTASDLMKTARHVERKRVTKHKQQQQLEPNPYHKAQYVSAYLEAKSAVISQHKAVERRHAETELMPTGSHSKELSLLSRELHNSYGAKRRSNLAISKEDSDSYVKHPHEGKQRKQQRISFGEWNEPIPSIQRGLHSLDVRLHTIARGCLTPPSLSPEALGRSTAAFAKPLRPLLERIQRLDDTRTSFVVQELVDELVVVLNGVNAKRPLKPFEWSNVVSLCIQHLFSSNTSCQDVYAFLENYLQKTRALQTNSAFLRDASQQVAVFAECVRFYNYGKGGPTVDQLAQMCKWAQGGTTRPLAPLTAAPLLSILHNTDSSGKPERVHTFLKAHLLHRKGKLAYLHSSAWGEYIQAIYRFGASTTEVQSLVDTCTDEATTVNAKLHLSSAHVWNAYLACSEASHALEVYQNNKAHYKLKGTSGTTAALMTSLARAHTASRAKEALQLFSALQQRGDMVHYTASTLTALLDNYCVLNDLTSTLSLALNFEAFFAPFGCSEEGFAAAYRRAISASSPADKTDQDPKRVRALVQALYAKNRSSFPKNVFDKWMTTYDSVSQMGKASSSPPAAQSTSAFSELTPDSLMDLL